MYPDTRTYWLEPTDRATVGLRRWARTDPPCPGPLGYHDSAVHIGLEPVRWIDTGYGRRTFHHRRAPAVSDPRWPTTCTACGYLFDNAGGRQICHELIYRRADTGDRVVLSPHVDVGSPVPAAPPGATWDAWWNPDDRRGPDGIDLMCRLPNGVDWPVDGHADHCTGHPDGNVRGCWVRHGDPRRAQVTVQPSIVAGSYHGWLRDGVLVAA